jgi:hypothetical protein
MHDVPASERQVGVRRAGRASDSSLLALKPVSATTFTANRGVSACPAISDNDSTVSAGCDGLTMNEPLQLRGIELRYALTMHLFRHGSATITELAEALRWHGFAVRGRASKAISDALRWEMRYGRVRRLGRGRYGPGSMPRGTEHRIHKRELALREQARLSLIAGHAETPLFGAAGGAHETPVA